MGRKKSYWVQTIGLKRLIIFPIKIFCRVRWIKSINSKDFKIEKYISSNRHSGSRIIIEEKDGDYLISIIKKKEKPTEGRIKWNKNIIHGKQVVDYIILNWSKLKASKTIEFDFLATLQMRVVGFEAYISKSEGNSHWVSIRPSSFVIRMLVPSIRFRFEEGKYPILKQYSGPYLINDGKHDEGQDSNFYYSLKTN